MTPVELEARRVTLSASHLRRYREVCAVRGGPQLPPAYLHVVAMPMHMQLFIAKQFPVKVLGLIHLRNTIRVLRDVDVRAPMRLSVHFDTQRLTDFGQEYDFTTRYEQEGAVVWEEVSTMFARGAAPPKEGGKRPSIERSAHPETGVATENARGRGQHWLALCARVRRFQSDPSDGAHREDVRVQTSRRARHVVARPMSRRGRSATTGGRNADRYAVQAPCLHSLACPGAHMVGRRRRAHLDVYAARRSPAPVNASTSTMTMDLLKGIETRTSALKLSSPGPSREQIEQIIQAGVRAPDHGRLRPWRFVVLEGAARENAGRCNGRDAACKSASGDPRATRG